MTQRNYHGNTTIKLLQIAEQIKAAAETIICPKWKCLPPNRDIYFSSKLYTAYGPYTGVVYMQNQLIIDNAQIWPFLTAGSVIIWLPFKVKHALWAAQAQSDTWWLLYKVWVVPSNRREGYLFFFLPGHTYSLRKTTNQRWWISGPFFRYPSVLFPCFWIKLLCLWWF